MLEKLFRKNKPKKETALPIDADKEISVASHKVGTKPSLGGRKLQGVVVSDKMQKTVVVAVSYFRLNPKYKKYYRVTHRLKAHDEKNEYHAGDKVVIKETRPLSREKRWVVIQKI